MNPKTPGFLLVSLLTLSSVSALAQQDHGHSHDGDGAHSHGDDAEHSHEPQDTQAFFGSAAADAGNDNGAQAGEHAHGGETHSHDGDSAGNAEGHAHQGHTHADGDDEPHAHD